MLSRVSTTLFTIVFLATAAIARPYGPSNRIARRLQSKPAQLISHAEATDPISQVQYSAGVAGAVYDSYPSGSFTSVTGTFTVPTLSTSSGSSSDTLSVWVGIDGDTCDTAILQTGIDFAINGSSVSYDAWYEWYPDYAYAFSGISFSAGDSVRLTVTASSTTSGMATIENLSTNTTVSQEITSTSALCEENAEWILEVYEGSGLDSIPDFGTLTIADAYASTASGTIGPSGATITEIEGEVSVSVSSSAVTIKYIG